MGAPVVDDDASIAAIAPVSVSLPVTALALDLEMSWGRTDEK